MFFVFLFLEYIDAITHNPIEYKCGSLHPFKGAFV